MRAPTEILGIRYFLLGVIFTRTNTRVESSHQGTPQNKNKSFSLSFPDCQSLWAGSAYITLGVASTFGPDHYILPHITQRIQAASAFQAGPHYILYSGAVPTLSHLQCSWCSWSASLLACSCSMQLASLNSVSGSFLFLVVHVLWDVGLRAAEVEWLRR